MDEAVPIEIQIDPDRLTDLMPLTLDTFTMLPLVWIR